MVEFLKRKKKDALQKYVVSVEFVGLQNKSQLQSKTQKLLIRGAQLKNKRKGRAQTDRKQSMLPISLSRTLAECGMLKKGIGD
jgi:hypothetical protein